VKAEDLFQALTGAVVEIPARSRVPGL